MLTRKLFSLRLRIITPVVRPVGARLRAAVGIWPLTWTFWADGTPSFAPASTGHHAAHFGHFAAKLRHFGLQLANDLHELSRGAASSRLGRPLRIRVAAWRQSIADPLARARSRVARAVAAALGHPLGDLDSDARRLITQASRVQVFSGGYQVPKLTVLVASGRSRKFAKGLHPVGAFFLAAWAVRVARAISFLRPVAVATFSLAARPVWVSLDVGGTRRVIVTRTISFAWAITIAWTIPFAARPVAIAAQALFPCPFTRRV